MVLLVCLFDISFDLVIPYMAVLDVAKSVRELVRIFRFVTKNKG